MDANAITFVEMKAFGELIGVEFTHWELIALEEMDNAALEAIYSGRSKAKKPAKKDEIEIDETKQIPADNVAGIRALLKRKGTKRGLGS